MRVPAFVLIPRKAKLPAPGVVALHDHGGFYLWGKEKLLPQAGEHQKAGAPDRQTTRLYDAPHEFNSDMQAEAWKWIGKWI